MGYTLGQAAKATGRSKATIAKAIASSRLSANKNEQGMYDIDPAELHRVYPSTKSEVNEREHRVATEQTAEVERLKATVEGLERLCRQIENDRDRLFHQLEGERDSLREQNIRLTALLTDQRSKPASEAIAMPPPAPPPHVPPDQTRNAHGSVPEAQGGVPKAEAGWFRRMMGGK